MRQISSRTGLGREENSNRIVGDGVVISRRWKRIQCSQFRAGQAGVKRMRGRAKGEPRQAGWDQLHRAP